MSVHATDADADADVDTAFANITELSSDEDVDAAFLAAENLTEEREQDEFLALFANPEEAQKKSTRMAKLDTPTGWARAIEDRNPITLSGGYVTRAITSTSTGLLSFCIGASAHVTSTTTSFARYTRP
jgi:hypothetical protein